MRHNLNIKVSKESSSGGVVACRNISLREKLLTKLMGPKQKVVVLIPGNSVDTVSITEIKEGGLAYEQN
jgi:hypothetical protein